MAIQDLAPHKESSHLYPADCNPGTFSLHNYPTQCHDGPLLITHSSFSRGAMSASSEQSSRGNQFSDSNTNDSNQPLSFSSFPSVHGPEKLSIHPSPLDYLNSHSPVRQNKKHVASLSICITPRHQTEARYTQTLSVSPHTSPKRKDPLDSRTVFHPSLPLAVQQVVFMFILSLLLFHHHNNTLHLYRSSWQSTNVIQSYHILVSQICDIKITVIWILFSFFNVGTC